MPRYEYTCLEGHSTEATLPVADRDAPPPCSCGVALRRVYSVPTILWAPGTHPVRGTSWYELYDKSPREMAQDKNISRYDPSMSHKPAERPVNLMQYMPTAAEAEGASRREWAPVEGEAAA